MQIEEIEKLLAEATANYATAIEVHAARIKLYSKCVPIILDLIAQVRSARQQAFLEAINVAKTTPGSVYNALRVYAARDKLRRKAEEPQE